MPGAHAVSAWAIYLLTGLLCLFLLQTYPAVYVQLTYEDRLAEWLQTWLFAAVTVLSAMLYRRNNRYRWFFLLLALGGFFTVMEEISWGQRVLGFASPEFFATNNIQGETNLHNFLTGPESTLIKDVIEYGLAAALLGYGLLYPLLLRGRVALAVWLDRLGVPPPPLYLCVFFISAAAFEIGWFKYNEAEVAEVFVGTALAFMLLHYRVAGDRFADAPPLLSLEQAGRCAVLNTVTFITLLGTAWVTTGVFYSLPGRAEVIDARLANGYEKFAGKYARRGRWSQAAELYRLGAELQPGNVALMRQALDSYERAGDQASYASYYRMMLDASAAEVIANQSTVENLLMLAVNYDAIDAAEPAERYANLALATAVERVALLPADAEAYYWLGRVQQARGDNNAAEQAYRQALKLDPARAKYTLALRSLN